MLALFLVDKGHVSSPQRFCDVWTFALWMHFRLIRRISANSKGMPLDLLFVANFHNYLIKRKGYQCTYTLLYLRYICKRQWTVCILQRHFHNYVSKMKSSQCTIILLYFLSIRQWNVCILQRHMPLCTKRNRFSDSTRMLSANCWGPSEAYMCFTKHTFICNPVS